MQVLLIRHAIAEDREIYHQLGRPDESRPLTEKGKKDFKKVSKTIRQLWPELSLIASSPLKRTSETALILKKEFKKSKLIYLPELEPDSELSDLQSWLRMMGRVSMLALVGHEPDLSRILSYFVAGQKQTIFKFKKGGFALIEFDNLIDKGTARLICSLQPSHLKKIRSAKTK